ncbi:hypothetical protein [Halorarius halobius]|uniref:hypothetical protein n=1 Tax=Halorarius halobius TaxID=2962671 RepID=UPI0020CE7F47|nr:hypothetical protein [Halorarius halobius]
MVDVEWALSQLGQVFHSEDHLKLALGAELAQMYGNERVRLEWNPEPGVKVDIGVRRGDVTIPIELKYKTKHATVEDAFFEETFELKTQGAHDRAHYRFLRDIERVERIVDNQGRYGYVVLLTNDSNYWTPSTEQALYDEFRIHEGREFGGKELRWREQRDWMSKGGEEAPINLSGQYVAEWSDYEYREEINVLSNSKFRAVMLRVDTQISVDE